jgi:hypothetical protein
MLNLRYVFMANKIVYLKMITESDNATFNNISVTGVSWHSVLFVEKTGVPRETTDLLQVADKLIM